MQSSKITKILIVSIFLSSLILNLTACGPLIIASAASGVAVLTDRRTTGTYIEDKAIEVKAFKNINENTVLAGQSNVSITSYNERVLITGQASNNSIKSQIESVVKSIPKVKNVYNEVIVANKNNLKKSSYDSWITTKVKTNLASDLRINPLDIKVTTNNKVVYLMGLVSPQESEIATNIVRKVYGVEKVVKLFEYIPENYSPDSPRTQFAEQENSQDHQQYG
ncbi:MAG: BON domain-containing protein [Gammaproteobacteria bacterium]|nr:BON domain-containing protein [Gammaproteobacteria bacterium]